MPNPLNNWDAENVPEPTVPGPRRFAFYGRCSTEDNQDPKTSRAWQIEIARNLIRDRGEIVIEYFDVSKSRSIPWKRRPESAALLAQLGEAAREFDAVVVGEGLRCWYGSQFSEVAPLFEHFGVEIWAPEVGGRYDHDNSAHSMVMSLTGGMSKNERTRVQERVKTSMAAQVVHEGRYQGGRPPYGYVAVPYRDHPNPRKAAEGYKLKRLELDEVAAPVVRWIYDEYLAGSSLRTITAKLNKNGVPCPSAHDPARNPHRSKDGWQFTTVRSIVANSRYTGYEEWGKFKKVEILIDPNDVQMGKRTKLVRSTDPRARSTEPSHEPIVSADEYMAAMKLLGYKRQSSTRERASSRQRPLRAVTYCGICGRRMQLETRPDGRTFYYRCRARDITDEDLRMRHPKSFRFREDAVLPLFIEWLKTDVIVMAQSRISQMAASFSAVPTVEEMKFDRAKKELDAADQAITRLLEAVEQGALDLALVRPRIARAQVDRENAAATVVAFETRRSLDAKNVQGVAQRLEAVIADAGSFLDSDMNEDTTKAFNTYLREKGFQIVCLPDIGEGIQVTVRFDETAMGSQRLNMPGLSD